MNKELETIKYLLEQCVNESIRKDLLDIEATLKDYEQIENMCESYDIEFSLVNIREALFTLAQLKGEKGNNWDNYNKKLKALEIIKEKRVNVEWLLETESVEEYNESLYIDLTQEEYDLLKEILL